MTLNKIGVIGAGSFGLTIASLISQNKDVLLYSRRKHIIDQVNQTHELKGIKLSPRISATNDLNELAQSCQLIFPVVKSAAFRSMMKNLSPYLKPSHLLIHGTKGLDLNGIDESTLNSNNLTKDMVKTMSEIIQQESSVVRIGCLSGPNLASEILEGQPTATVIASEFDEVIDAGKACLASDRFYVFGSHDIIATEIAGAYKNIIALASGILGGLGMGRNIQALLITRGLREMIKFGISMGCDTRPFIGTAGIGDLIATATSKNSRNYNCGFQMAQGKTYAQIIADSTEVVEGGRTLKIAFILGQRYSINIPVTNILYHVVYENLDIKRAITLLMNRPDAQDVDFL